MVESKLEGDRHAGRLDEFLIELRVKLCASRVAYYAQAR